MLTCDTNVFFFIFQIKASIGNVIINNNNNNNNTVKDSYFGG